MCPSLPCSYEERAEDYFRQQAQQAETLRQRLAVAAAVQQSPAAQGAQRPSAIVASAFNAPLSEESQQRVQERVEAKMEQYVVSLPIAEVSVQVPKRGCTGSMQSHARARKQSQATASHVLSV